ncbi:MAG TPA: nitroreductase family protein [Acidimicrobiales bacterium]|nr:nitroreductase family protein [Acidimicrobiales bacterium]
MTDAPGGFDLDQVDRLLTTTKQVRKRLDLTRPVPRALLLECIDIAQHAPMGGNLERNRWLVVDDPELKAAIAPLYQDVGRPYLAANAAAPVDEAQQRVIDSATFLVDHIAEVPAMVIALRLDRLPAGASNAEIAGYHGSVAPGVWSFQLAARARGLGSAWTTFHLVHEQAVAELLGIPDTVTQVALLPVGFYTGTSFTPATRRPAREITSFNRWKQFA